MFSTLLHIGLGLALAFVAFFVGSTFWQLLKRANFLQHTIKDEQLLRKLITRATLETAATSPHIAPFVRPWHGPQPPDHSPGAPPYFINISALITANQSSQRLPKRIAVALLAALFIFGWFLGVPYFVAVAIAFLLAAPSRINPITQSASQNAVEHVVSVAVILDRWRQEDATGCEHWIEKASSLRPLYNAVKAADR